MGEKRVRGTKELEFKVALEAIKGEKQLAEIAAEFRVHPQQVTLWKKELLEKGAALFATQAERDTRRLEEQREELYKTIGHQSYSSGLMTQGSSGS